VTALRQELARLVNYHPATVEAETELVDLCVIESDPSGRLDRVDV
jgi:hypothetical protein